MIFRKFTTIALSGVALTGLALGGMTLASMATANPASAQVAGGVVKSVEVDTVLARGWSTKRTVLGQNVYDKAGSKIGDIDDVLFDKKTGKATLLAGVGGFLGIGEHYVKVDANALATNPDGKLVWTNATKDEVKKLPAVDRSKLADELSFKKNLSGRKVYNDAKENIGTISDVIISPSETATLAILDVGSYLGMDKHHAAVPVASITFGDEARIGNATKESVKALPAFNYTK